MRAGGATSLAEHGVPPPLIQAMGPGSMGFTNIPHLRAQTPSSPTFPSLWHGPQLDTSPTNFIYYTDLLSFHHLLSSHPTLITSKKKKKKKIEFSPTYDE